MGMLGGALILLALLTFLACMGIAAYKAAGPAYSYRAVASSEQCSPDCYAHRYKASSTTERRPMHSSTFTAIAREADQFSCTVLSAILNPQGVHGYALLHNPDRHSYHCASFSVWIEEETLHGWATPPGNGGEQVYCQFEENDLKRKGTTSYAQAAEEYAQWVLDMAGAHERGEL